MSTLKTILLRAVQAMLLTILFLVFFAAGGAIFIPANLMPATVSQPGPFASPFDMLVVGAGHALVLMLVILSSRWRGWKLMLAVSFAYYGLITVMAQIETAYFLSNLTVSPELLPRLFLMGIPPAVLFIPLAVLILGKGFKSPADEQPNPRLVMPLGQWAWKLVLIMLAYLILYFSAGYFIAWQNPELRAFYNGTDPGNFFLQMRSIILNDPRLVPFQMLRALLWTLFSLPIIRMTRGKSWWTAILLGLMLAVPFNVGHLLSNPLLPLASVRMSHLIETASSNFVFGLVMVWLLHRQHTSIRDLLG